MKCVATESARWQAEGLHAQCREPLMHLYRARQDAHELVRSSVGVDQRFSQGDHPTTFSEHRFAGIDVLLQGLPHGLVSGECLGVQFGVTTR